MKFDDIPGVAFAADRLLPVGVLQQSWRPSPLYSLWEQEWTRQQVQAFAACAVFHDQLVVIPRATRRKMLWFVAGAGLSERLSEARADR